MSSPTRPRTRLSPAPCAPTLPTLKASILLEASRAEDLSGVLRPAGDEEGPLAHRDERVEAEGGADGLALLGDVDLS